MADLNSIFTRVNSYVSSRNGRALANELSLPIGQSLASYARLIDSMRRVNVLSYAQSNIIESNLAMVLGYKLSALVNLANDNYEAGE